MQDNRENLFISLKNIYGEKVYDLDKKDHIKTLKNNGWIFEKEGKQIKRPDFLILEFDGRIILIELKEFEEKPTDRDLREKIETTKPGEVITYLIDPYTENLREHIKTSNKQFKKFLGINGDKFFKNGKVVYNFSNVVALYCKRIIHDYTLPGVMEELFGKIYQKTDKYLQSYFTIRDRDMILKKKTYRAISLIATWDGKEKFYIYNNPFTLVENNIPIFLTKKDINRFIIDDYFSQLTGIRILVIKEIKFDKNETIKYLINDRYIDEEKFFEVLHSEIKNKEEMEIMIKSKLRKRVF